MDISGAIDKAIEFFYEYIQPHLGTFFKIAAIVLIVIILLRIFVPMIWENILVGIIKLSDKKSENEKEDEK